jgi:hypothetical protein
VQRHHIVGFGVGSFLTTVGLSYWLARPSDPASVVQVPQDAASVVAGDDGPVAAASSSADAAAPCADAKVCNAENAKLCPDYFKAGVGLAPVADWSARASAAGYSTGSPKLAGQDCSKPTAPSGPRAAWSSPTAGPSSTPACASTAPPSAGCAPG